MGGAQRVMMAAIAGVGKVVVDATKVAPRRRLIAKVVAVAAVAALLPTIAPTPWPVEASPPAGLFIRASNAVQLGGEGTVFAKVVTDGQGLFHSVVRQNTDMGQWILYRRSSDAGRSWQTAGRFAGPGGGATRPEIAVDGPRVAVAFIGARCDDGPSSCVEVPMLVTSDDGGVNWKRPMMLSPNWGSGIAVAQSGATTWVAWERPNVGVAVRRVTNGAVEFSHEFAGWSAPFVQASGSFALFAGATASGTRLAAASIPEGMGPERIVPGTLEDIALADGTGHAIVKTDGAMSVWSFDVSIGVTITPGTPVVIGTGMVTSADLDARRGLLVATWTVLRRSGDVESAEAYAASSKDKGATFGPGHLVADNPNGPFLSSRITIGQTVGDAPIATFNWKVAAKYTDGPDLDSLPEPANALGDPGLDLIEVERSAKVTLDGCDSIASPGRTIASDAYEWAVDGAALDATGCSFVTDLPANERYKVTLTVRDSADQIGQTEMVVEPKDMLVVSIGDSVASGEGSPHRNSIPSIGDSETWQDQACHRSAYAGPALAARQLEADSEHSSVTFVQLACSGAAIMDVPEVPGGDQEPTDDRTSGGLLDGYEGVEPLGAPTRPGQLDQLDQLRGSRSVDVLMLSIGANDVKFSEVVEECLVTAPGEFAACTNSSTKTRFDTRIDTLPSRYAALATRLGESGIDPSDVFITEYFDQTTDQFGMPNMRCVASEALDIATGLLSVLGPEVEFLISLFAAGGLITDDEARFARDYVGPSLNQAVASAASTHSWNYVGGIASQFYKHGYCAEVLTDAWVVQIGESLAAQHDKFGSFHPNRDGQKVYGDALFRSIRSKGLLTNSQSAEEVLQGDAIGDVYVLTSSDRGVTAIALRDGGNALIPVGSRRLAWKDGDVENKGQLWPTSPIAASGLDAVAVWNEIWDVGTRFQTYSAPVALVDNVTVNNARVVQAPIDSTKLVAGRPLVVTAGIDAHVAEPVMAKVHTVVEDANGVLFDSTETVRLEPGIQTLVLPASGPLTSTGGAVDAQVRIEPLPKEPLVLHTDNEAIAPQARAQEGRRALLTIVPTVTESHGSVTCGQAAQTAGTMAAFTEAVLPVTGVDTEISCTPPAPLASSTSGVWAALLEMDEYAQLTGRDAVAGVVPDGWLQAVAGGAIGVAAPGVRSMLIERSANESTLAHEFAHVRGVDHIVGAAAGGAWVARRQPILGQDLMNPTVVRRPWVGGATWEHLLEDLGGPARTPESPDFSATGVTWIRGAVWPAADGKFAYQPGRWASPNDTSYDPGDLDELEVERLTAVQVDTETGTSTSVPVGLASVDGLFGPGADPTRGPLGQVFVQRLTLEPGVDRIDMVLDGAVVESRPVSANAPTVTVTSPVIGTVVGSNEVVDVKWVGADADGDSLTYTVLISPDGGTTWRPVATGLPATETSFTFPSPDDIDSRNVVLRVVASDGVRSGYGDSVTIGVLASIQTDPPRVVYVQHRRVDDPNRSGSPFRDYLGQPGEGLFTMTPTGTDVQPLVPYTLALPGSPFSPLRPFWNSDATKVSFDAMTSNGTRQLFVVNRDGTGLRQVTSTADLACASWHPDGTKLLTTNTSDSTLRVVDVETGALLANLGQSKTDRVPERAGCPRYSPDGMRILATQDKTLGIDSGGFLVLLDATGTRLRLQDDAFSGYVPIWSPDGTLAASQNLGQGCATTVLNGQTFARVPLFQLYREALPAGVNRMCFASMGFVSNSDLWFTSTDLPWPRSYTGQICGAFFCSLGPIVEPVGRFCTAPITVEPVATCYSPDETGIPVSSYLDTPDVGVFQADYYRGVSEEQTGSGPVVIPPPPAPGAADAGGPYAGVVGSLLSFSSSASTALLGAGASTAVTWDLDGDGAFDDAVGISPDFGYETAGTYDVKVRITPLGGGAITSAVTRAVIAPMPVQTPVIVDDSAAPPVVGPTAPADFGVTVPMDTTTPIRLRLADGSTTRFTVDTASIAEEFTVAYPRPGDPWEGPSTAQDGIVSFAPPAGFIGQVTFTYRRSDRSPAAPTFGTVTVDVRGNRPPVVGNDTLTVQPATLVTIDPDVLLANDEDPDPSAPALPSVQGRLQTGLSLVNVVSGTNTTAWLGTDGMIRLRLDGTSGTIAYLVGDPLGAFGLGSVTVTAPADTTTPPTIASTPPAVVTAPAGSANGAAGLRFQPVRPARLADTRSSTPLEAGETLRVVVAGRADVPADAKGVALSVTAVDSRRAGFLTVWPCGTERPLASSVNYVDGDIAANAVTVGVGANDDGAVCIYSMSTTDVVVDVNGYWSTNATAAFAPITPMRVTDTRNTRRVPARSTTAIDLSSVVPTDATAVALNLTAVQASASGFLTVFPCGSTVPLASNLNVPAGGTVAVSVLAGRGAGGTVCVYNFIETDIVVDVTGWFGASGASVLRPDVPTRLLDTRQLATPMPGAGSVTRVAVPAGSVGAVLNVTGVDGVDPGFVTVYVCSDTRPWTSNLNVEARRARANQVLIGAGGGTVCIYTQSATHLVVDRTGTFVNST